MKNQNYKKNLQNCGSVVKEARQSSELVVAHPRSLAIDGWMVEGGGWAEREWGEEGDGHGSMIVVGGSWLSVCCGFVVVGARGLRWS